MNKKKTIKKERKLRIKNNNNNVQKSLKNRVNNG